MKELFVVITAIIGFYMGMDYYAKWYPDSTEKKVDLSEYIPKPETK